jgi:hypothetical protein
VDDDAPNTVHYREFDLRPGRGRRVRLVPVKLVGPEELAGMEVRLQWGATATNVDGEVVGEIAVPFAADPVVLMDLSSTR